MSIFSTVENSHVETGVCVWVITSRQRAFSPRACFPRSIPHSFPYVQPMSVSLSKNSSQSNVFFFSPFFFQQKQSLMFNWDEQDDDDDDDDGDNDDD